jgi:hypothetical protein
MDAPVPGAPPWGLAVCIPEFGVVPCGLAVCGPEFGVVPCGLADGVVGCCGRRVSMIGLEQIGKS